jgi:hypothetical protein
MRHFSIYVLQFFQHYPINGTIFEKKLSIMKCVLWYSLQIVCGTFLIPRRIERDMISYACGSSSKIPDTLLRFKWNLKFLDRFAKNTQISNFMKMRPLGAELFRTDGRIDMTTLLFAFHNFANASKNWTFCPHSVFMCFVSIWEQTAIIFLFSINYLLFITQIPCFYCAVRPNI